jgi:type IV pilus assembly protein PilV
LTQQGTWTGLATDPILNDHDEQLSRHMRSIGNRGRKQGGVMLLEVLIAILIFSMGILAVVGMQATAIKNVTDSKYRSQAAFLTNKLLSQMWTDAGNISLYNYPAGTTTVPPKLQNWLTNTANTGVNDLLPDAAAAANQPIVTVTGATANGAQVTIQVFWRMPEERSKNLPPHSYTVTASVYTS